MKGGPPFVGGGKARVCTVYVDNLVEGLYVAATRQVAEGQTYIIADDGDPTWRELMGHFADALGTRAPRLSIPTPLARMAGGLVEGFCWLSRWRLAPPITRYRVAIVARDCHFSNAKAKAQLDWTPRVSFEEGIERTVDWYLAEGRN
jgi:nucleoside-diphosphate-sugar epimerase